MNNRLQQFLAAENISQSQFAESIGVAPANVSHVLAGRNKPGFDFLESMARRYPSLSLEWLITGRGRMYSADTSKEYAKDNVVQIVENKRSVSKILVFFDDGTYQELK